MGILQKSLLLEMNSTPSSVLVVPGGKERHGLSAGLQQLFCIQWDVLK